MEIRALTPDLAEAFFAFFDQRAFADNPYWKGCYCTFFHRPKRLPEEEARPRSTRREQARTLIARCDMRGYLAYGDDGQVVGWCNANRKQAFARLDAAGVPEDGVLSIVCFVIDPARRRQGIARALLARVIQDAAVQGFRWVEAYPSARARTASGHYHGPLALYEALGFQRLPGRKLVVRKALETRP
jgi:GNAT superfamily N-acetyltransferase